MLDRLDRYQKTACATRADAGQSSRLSEDDALVVEDLERRMREQILQEIAAEQATQQMSGVQS